MYFRHGSDSKVFSAARLDASFNLDRSGGSCLIPAFNDPAIHKRLKGNAGVCISWTSKTRGKMQSGRSRLQTLTAGKDTKPTAFAGVSARKTIDNLRRSSKIPVRFSKTPTTARLSFARFTARFTLMDH